MPRRDWTIRIYDILKAIETIQQYVSGMTFEEFAADRKTVDAVVRNLIVLGEATVHVPDDVCCAHPEVPWYEMKGMRNFIVHEYFNVSDKVLWNTIRNDLTPLIPLLKKLLV